MAREISAVLEYGAPAPGETAIMEDKLRFHTNSWDLSVDLRAGLSEIVVIEARSRDAYAAGHIPGAVSFPHQEMSAETAAQFDRSKVYVVYCDGIGCNASTKGAYKLAALGFRVKELLGGIDWWHRDGAPGGRFARAGQFTCSRIAASRSASHAGEFKRLQTLLPMRATKHASYFGTAGQSWGRSPGQESRNIAFGKSIRSAALNTVERPLARVVENPESLVVGAELVRLDIEFQKQTVFRSGFKLDNVAGSFGYSIEGADHHPILIGGCLHAQLPHSH
jgi:rhodanese-related sulfurtransferase